MKHIILSILISGLAILSYTPYGLATSFTTNYEAIKGFQWLSFAATQGKSRADVETLLTTEFSGYKYASRAETATFIEAAYGGPIDFNTTGDTHIENVSLPGWLEFTTDETRLHNDTNQRYHFYEVSFLYGERTEVIDNLEITLSNHFSFYKFDGTDIYNAFFYQEPAHYPIYQSYPTMASLLVKHPVPEPTSFALYALGLLGISLLRPKR